MKQLSSRIVLELGIGVIAGIVCASALGCSSSSDGNGGGNVEGAGGGGGGGSAVGPDGCATQDLTLAFTPMYSAFDGQHEFKIPAIANGVSGASVTWSASDPTMVSLQTDDATGGTMITTLKAGTVDIQAKSGTRCGVSKLTITAATPADYEAGDKRYNSGFPLPDILPKAGQPPPMLPTDGSNPLEIPGKPPACTNCHGDTATTSIFQTVSHTPEQTGGFSDDELAGIFMTGTIPPGGYYDSKIIPQQIWQSFHKWTDITDDQTKKGVVVYLRGLTPKPQNGKIDFQQLRPPTTGTGGDTGAGGTTAAGGTTGSGGKPASGGTTGAGGTTATGGASATGGSAGASGGGGGAAGGAGGASAGGAAGSGGTH